MNVTLTATVSATASTVNAGTVTFQLKNGATDVGSAVVDSSIINGVASVTYTLPAGRPRGDYTIVATYSGTANFYGSFDNTATPDRRQAADLHERRQPDEHLLPSRA